MTSARPAPAREPGDVSGRVPASPAARRRRDRSLAYGTAAAILGAAVLFALAGPLSVDTGLLVVGVAVGWVVGVAVRTGAARARVPASGSGTRVAAAIALTLASCAVAWAGTWAWSHVQGGVLGPGDFMVQVYGMLVPAQALFATAAAAAGSR